jgi:hypothetical protein
LDEISNPAMIEAGIDALACVGDIDAETIVEVNYGAMVGAAFA